MKSHVMLTGALAEGGISSQHLAESVRSFASAHDDMDGCCRPAAYVRVNDGVIMEMTLVLSCTGLGIFYMCVISQDVVYRV